MERRWHYQQMWTQIPEAAMHLYKWEWAAGWEDVSSATAREVRRTLPRRTRASFGRRLGRLLHIPQLA
jgi:hypothetical protein